ncbi:MAG: bifunctional serine/threonine-protein kinase/formylglycine-generating enzyme family protein [Ardenticatenaceae bacterium]
MIPNNIGRYEVMGEVGAPRKGGEGAGRVYRARDPHFGRDVAIKLLPLWDDPTLQKSFQGDVQRLMSFEHPAIIPLYDFGTYLGEHLHNEQAFLVMKFMSGGSLADRLAEGALSLDEAAHIFAFLAPAIDEAHAHGIVHYNLKPSNILFDQRNRPYIADFGLANVVEEASVLVPAPQTSQLGRHRSAFMGTPAYISPQRARGMGDMDGRSDIYALGVTLFEMLTGELPYQAQTALGMALGHVNDPIPRVHQIRPDLPPETQIIINHALAKEADRRYPTATALSEAVTALAMGKEIVPPHTSSLSSVPFDTSASSVHRKLRNQGATAAPKPSEKLFQRVFSGKDEAEKSSPAHTLEPPRVVQLPQTEPLSQSPPLAPSLPRESDSSASPLPSLAPLPPEEPKVKAPRRSSQKKLWAQIGVLGSVILFLGWFLISGSYQSLRAVAPTAQIEPTAIPIPTPVPALTSQKDGMTQLYVPAGEFLMGSQANDSDADQNEQPQRTVTLDAFWIDQTEVTNAMFGRFAQESGYQTDVQQVGSGLVYLPSSDRWEEIEGTSWQQPVGPKSTIDGLGNYPVMQVSWNDANAYCEWVGRRLPTEAEWEKAARGTDGHQYPWGNDPVAGNLLNYCDTTCLTTTGKDDTVDDGNQDFAPVGSYPDGASPYGTLDMSGNVWEWVADWFDQQYYQNAPNNNPPGPQSGTHRVLRGGSWANNRTQARAAARTAADPAYGIDNLGFRCAMSPK